MPKTSVIPEVLTATREAERGLLGAILIQASYTENVIGEVKSLVSPDDFLDAKQFDNKHSRIFKAMCECQQPHQINVAQQMNRQGTLKPGDCAYLSYLVSNCPCSLDYLSYAQAIREYADLRNGIRPSKYRGLAIN